MNQKHKGEPIGEGFLIGVGQEFGLGVRVDGRPLVRREFVPLDVLIGKPREGSFYLESPLGLSGNGGGDRSYPNRSRR
jgi:hypothetical protein